MHIYVIAPIEDENISEVLIAQKGDASEEEFEKTWNNVIKRLNELDQIWCLDDAIKIMEAKGWKIIIADHTKLTY